MNKKDCIEYLDNHFEKEWFGLNIDINIFAHRLAPFIHIVNYWSQILGLLVYKCSDKKLRKNIITNLYDEHFNTDIHVDTFYKFILECGYIDLNINIGNNNDIGIGISDVYNIQINSVIIKYMEKLKSYVYYHDFSIACQILGAIEYTYYLISSKINIFYKQKLNRLPNNHYTTHENTDIEHANKLFDCAVVVDEYLDPNYLDIGSDWIIGVFRELLS